MQGNHSMESLKGMHQQILHNVEMVQDRSSKILQEQEKDLLRAFRARLFDVQVRNFVIRRNTGHRRQRTCCTTGLFGAQPPCLQQMASMSLLRCFALVNIFQNPLAIPTTSTDTQPCGSVSNPKFRTHAIVGCWSAEVAQVQEGIPDACVPLAACLPAACAVVAIPPKTIEQLQ